MGKKTAMLLLPLIIITSSNCCWQHDATNTNVNTGLPEESKQVLRAYGRDWLLSLRRRAAPDPGLLNHVPDELL